MLRAFFLLVLVVPACGGSKQSETVHTSSVNDTGFEESSTTHLPASQLVQRGEALLKSGKAEEALAQFSAALEKDAKDARAHYDAALAYEMLNKSKQAASHYEQAILHVDDFVEAINNLAMIRRDTGRLEEAGALLERALKVQPGFGSARLNVALVCMKTLVIWNSQRRRIGKL